MSRDRSMSVLKAWQHNIFPNILLLYEIHTWLRCPPPLDWSRCCPWYRSGLNNSIWAIIDVILCLWFIWFHLVWCWYSSLFLCLNQNIEIILHDLVLNFIWQMFVIKLNSHTIQLNDLLLYKFFTGIILLISSRCCYRWHLKSFCVLSLSSQSTHFFSQLADLFWLDIFFALELLGCLCICLLFICTGPGATAGIWIQRNLLLDQGGWNQCWLVRNSILLRRKAAPEESKPMNERLGASHQSDEGIGYHAKIHNFS